MIIFDYLVCLEYLVHQGYLGYLEILVYGEYLVNLMYQVYLDTWSTCIPDPCWLATPDPWEAPLRICPSIIPLTIRYTGGAAQ